MPTKELAQRPFYKVSIRMPGRYLSVLRTESERRTVGISVLLRLIVVDMIEAVTSIPARQKDEKDELSKPIAFEIPNAIYQLLATEANKRGVGFSSLLRLVIKNHINKQKNLLPSLPTKAKTAQEVPSYV